MAIAFHDPKGMDKAFRATAKKSITDEDYLGPDLDGEAIEDAALVDESDDDEWHKTAFRTDSDS